MTVSPMASPAPRGGVPENGQENSSAPLARKVRPPSGRTAAPLLAAVSRPRAETMARWRQADDMCELE